MKNLGLLSRLFSRVENMTNKQSRKEDLLYGLVLPSLTGVEIGPLDKPIILRSESKILYADHADTESLRKKYANDTSVNADAIPGIDIILAGNNLAASAGHDSLDYIVASHVIEHTPDFIGFLLDCVHALREGGVLCLAVPDCRYTFDVFRRHTFLEDVEIAHTSVATRPSLDQVIDHAKNIVDLDQGLAWENRPLALQKARLKHLRSNIPRLIEMHQSGQYMDVHCWVFTPGAFLRLTNKVCLKYKIPLGIRRFVSTRYMKNEFLVQLVKLSDDRDIAASWPDNLLQDN